MGSRRLVADHPTSARRPTTVIIIRTTCIRRPYVRGKVAPFLRCLGTGILVMLSSS
jgi:hypothetical protein